MGLVLAWEAVPVGVAVEPLAGVVVGCVVVGRPVGEGSGVT